MSQEIMEGIRTIEREKGIETGTLVAALEDALLAAAAAATADSGAAAQHVRDGVSGCLAPPCDGLDAADARYDVQRLAERRQRHPADGLMRHGEHVRAKRREARHGEADHRREEQSFHAESIHATRILSEKSLFAMTYFTIIPRASKREIACETHSSTESLSVASVRSA